MEKENNFSDSKAELWEVGSVCLANTKTESNPQKPFGDCDLGEKTGGVLGLND